MLINSLLAFAFSLSLNASASPFAFEEGAHCVAYQVEKVLFFIKTQTVVGKNCDVSAQVLPELGGLYRIEVNIPIRSFRSGDSERDKDVMRILMAEERPELTFRSKSLSSEGWRDLFAKKGFSLDGELTIGQNSFPLKLDVSYTDSDGKAEVDGEAKVKFTHFNLKPPTIAGGIIVKAKPDLELYFRLQSQRILGADSIRLGRKNVK